VCNMQRCNRARLLVRSVLVEDATIEVYNCWQEVRWWKMQQYRGARLIGKKCAGRRCDNRGVQLLARSTLVGDATIEVCSYRQEVHWWEMRQ
jgi:hypothetical protein